VSYADRTRRPPRTLTDDEQRRLLKASGEHADTFRDHLIFSLALGCALREHELAALTVGDVVNRHTGQAKRTIELRVFKGWRQRKGTERVHVPDGAFYKLEKYLKARKGADPSDPLFVSREGGHLSNRRLREIFDEWQRRAGFAYRYNFHTLRHTSLTNVYRVTKNIRLVQRVGRHARLDTTVRYEHASEAEVAAAVRGLAS